MHNPPPHGSLAKELHLEGSNSPFPPPELLGTGISSQAVLVGCLLSLQNRTAGFPGAPQSLGDEPSLYFRFCPQTLFASCAKEKEPCSRRGLPSPAPPPEMRTFQNLPQLSIPLAEAHVHTYCLGSTWPTSCMGKNVTILGVCLKPLNLGLHL